MNAPILTENQNPAKVITLSKSKMRHWPGDKDDFITYLLDLLIPALRKQGCDESADELETAVWFMCGGD